MHKVVVERPRWNPGPGKKGRRANLPDELLPKYEGIRRPHMNRKMFTDLLGPLRRWLRAQIGRPWNDVYSEACAVIKPDSVIRAHVKTHLLEFVQRHTFMRDGRVWCFSERWGSPEMLIELAGPGRCRSAFYVDPETGFLCEIPRRQNRPRYRDEEAKKRASTHRRLNETTLLRQLNGFWFECRLKPIPKTGSFDLIEKRIIGPWDAWKIYRRYVYCASKRQLSRRDLRELGLSNHSHSQTESSLQLAMVLAC
jgi:hypothetical protein